MKFFSAHITKHFVKIFFFGDVFNTFSLAWNIIATNAGLWFASLPKFSAISDYFGLQEKVQNMSGFQNSVIIAII